MIKQLLAKAGAGKIQVGIEVQSEGLAVVVCRDLLPQTESSDAVGGARFSPQISSTSVLLDASSNADRSAALATWVEKSGLQKAPCTVVLSNADYQLLLVEAPDVPEAEMRDAIRWRIKDLISIPVEKAAVDVFLLPADGARGGKAMAYVVVTELSRVSQLVAILKSSGLKLESIDIGELALRNLAYLFEPVGGESRGVAIVRLQEGRGVVSLFRNGNMYLSRQFQIQYGGGLLDDIPIDTFNLEVQRSLDYFERQMGQIPPSALFVCGENISEDKIPIDIVRGINVPVKYFDVAKLVSSDEGLESNVLHSCIAALGGSLREQVAADYEKSGGIK